MAQTHSSAILEFARGGTDHRGRTRESILARDDCWLEATHDFIQWLFPLPEPSRYNPQAPILRATDIAAFREDATLRAGLLHATRRMLQFYGFEPPWRWPAAEAGWISPGNHNFLRISRILRCLALLGCEAQAAGFLQKLERLAGQGAAATFGGATLAHWRDAAGGDMPRLT